MVSFFHASTPLKKALVDIPAKKMVNEHQVFSQIPNRAMQMKYLPKNRVISRIVTIQSAKITLNTTPMLIPSMSIGWKSNAKS